jgi:threonine synthase
MSSQNTSKLSRLVETEELDRRDALFPLLDGATGDVEDFPKLGLDKNHVTDNHFCSSEERLEAYEDIIDSEVGDTSLLRARNSEREFGFRQLYLKFEGSNPTGTQKDRIAFAQAMDALRRGYDTVTLATCGNYGAAVALATATAGLRCVVHVPSTYHTKRLEEMIQRKAEIVRVSGDYEHAIEVSRELADREEFYDANPGGANTALQLHAYGRIAYEIYDELRDAPRAVAVPVSNGTTLAGIFRGFLSLYRRGKTSRLPMMVTGSSHNKNSIVHSFLSGNSRCEDLPPEKIHETSINEPLINWHSADGDLALDAIRRSHGRAGNASDRKLAGLARLLRDKEGLNVLPASTAGLLALVDWHGQNPLENDRFVAVLTGRNG